MGALLSKKNNAGESECIPRGSSARSVTSMRGSILRHSQSFDTINTSAEIPFFDQFGPEHAKKMKKLFVRTTFKKGTVIAEQGVENDSLYGLFIIVSGDVRVLAKDPETSRLVSLKVLSKGQWFGVARLPQGVLMPITAEAATDATMLVLPVAALKELEKSNPDMALSITAGNKVVPFDGRSLQLLTYSQTVSLSTIPFFEGIDIPTLHQMASLFEYRKYKANRYLYRQGDPANGIYIVVSGTVAMVATRQDGTETLLSLISKPEYFGELALFTADPMDVQNNPGRRTVSIRTMCETELLYLSSQDFAKFITVAPHVVHSEAFKGSLQKRTAESLKAIPFFSDYETKQVGPLMKFDEDALSILGELFEYVHYPDKYCVFTQGSTGDAFYLIVAGSVEVTSVSAHDTIATLATLTEGDWFGEISLIMDTKRTATVTTLEPSVFLKLTKERFQKVWSWPLPRTSRDVFGSDLWAAHVADLVANLTFAQHMRTSEWLKNLPFFSGIKENKPWSKLGLLGSQFKFRECVTGEVVCQQGQRDDRTFYLIVLGKVRVTILDDGKPVELDTLGECQWFGEIALLNDTPRTATVTCVEPTLLCYLTLACFEKFMDIAPELRQTMSCLVAQRTSNTLRSTFPLFKNIKENRPWSKLAVLASLMTYQNVDHDVDIIRQGDPGRSLYFILKGGVIITIKHPEKGFEIVLDTLTEGDLFGEVALLKNVDRGATESVCTATVRSIDDCTLLVLSLECFRNFLSMSRELLPEIENLAKVREERVLNALKSTTVPSGHQLQKTDSSATADSSHTTTKAASIADDDILSKPDHI
ncbi:hypothetical protein PBRA_005452 [Plasmodiophora brassicae]|uniref:Cyclic nucleotide-binding domain-containing protein n=1 Tax=Plasmodiophora brassicae TaxID=37360 RepID=A0A0G4INF7_PLABS|nr:hypothetical protein PBRA_005452 [Plasmodiophora brassicae]